MDKTKRDELPSPNAKDSKVRGSHTTPNLMHKVNNAESSFQSTHSPAVVSPVVLPKVESPIDFDTVAVLEDELQKQEEKLKLAAMYGLQLQDQLVQIKTQLAQKENTIVSLNSQKSAAISAFEELESKYDELLKRHQSELKKIQQYNQDKQRYLQITEEYHRLAPLEKKYEANQELLSSAEAKLRTATAKLTKLEQINDRLNMEKVNLELREKSALNREKDLQRLLTEASHSLERQKIEHHNIKFIENKSKEELIQFLHEHRSVLDNLDNSLVEKTRDMAEQVLSLYPASSEPSAVEELIEEQATFYLILALVNSQLRQNLELKLKQANMTTMQLQDEIDSLRRDISDSDLRQSQSEFKLESLEAELQKIDVHSISEEEHKKEIQELRDHYKIQLESLASELTASRESSADYLTQMEILQTSNSELSKKLNEIILLKESLEEQVANRTTELERLQQLHQELQQSINQARLARTNSINGGSPNRSSPVKPETKKLLRGQSVVTLRDLHLNTNLSPTAPLAPSTNNDDVKLARTKSGSDTKSSPFVKPSLRHSRTQSVSTLSFPLRDSGMKTVLNRIISGGNIIPPLPSSPSKFESNSKPTSEEKIESTPESPGNLSFQTPQSRTPTPPIESRTPTPPSMMSQSTESCFASSPPLESFDDESPISTPTPTQTPAADHSRTPTPPIESRSSTPNTERSTTPEALPRVQITPVLSPQPKRLPKPQILDQMTLPLPTDIKVLYESELNQSPMEPGLEPISPRIPTPEPLLKEFHYDSVPNPELLSPLSLFVNILYEESEDHLEPRKPLQSLYFKQLTRQKSQLSQRITSLERKLEKTEEQHANELRERDFLLKSTLQKLREVESKSSRLESSLRKIQSENSSLKEKVQSQPILSKNLLKPRDSQGEEFDSHHISVQPIQSLQSKKLNCLLYEYELLQDRFRLVSLENRALQEQIKSMPIPSANGLNSKLFSIGEQFPELQCKPKIVVRSGIHANPFQQQNSDFLQLQHLPPGMTNIELDPYTPIKQNNLPRTSRNSNSTFDWTMNLLRWSCTQLGIPSNLPYHNRVVPLQYKTNNGVVACCWHPRKPLLCVAFSQHVDVYKFKNTSKAFTRVHQYSNPNVKILSVAWKESEKHLALGCENSILVWHLAKNHQFEFKHRATRNVSSLQWQPNGRLLAVGSPNEGVEIWDIYSKEPLLLPRMPPASSYLLKWSPNGSYLFQASFNSTFTIWETKTWTKRTWNLADGAICQSAAWSADSEYLLFSLREDSNLYCMQFSTQNLSPDGWWYSKIALDSFRLQRPNSSETTVCGFIQKIEWDATSDTLALLFESDLEGDNANMIALLNTSLSPSLEFSPVGFIPNKYSNTTKLEDVCLSPLMAKNHPRILAILADDGFLFVPLRM